MTNVYCAVLKESEEHILFQCTKYSSLRAHLFIKFESEFPNFSEKFMDDKIKILGEANHGIFPLLNDELEYFLSIRQT